MRKLLDKIAGWVWSGIDWQHFADAYEEEFAAVVRRIKRDPEFKHFCQELLKEYERWEKHGQKTMTWDAWITSVIGWEQEEAG